MPSITRLEAQKRDKQRVNIYVDDEFFCGITLDDVVRHKLSVGLVLTESDLTNLTANADENKYFNKALEYLLTSPKTELQIKQYLYKKQLDPNTITTIITRLKKYNYINDADYAQNFAQTKSTKLGRKNIQAKLMQKGINRDIITESVNEIGDQTDLVRATAEKYMRNKTPSRETFAKLYRYLIGKGFDFDTASAIMDECKSE